MHDAEGEARRAGGAEAGEGTFLIAPGGGVTDRRREGADGRGEDRRVSAAALDSLVRLDAEVAGAMLKAV